MFLSNVAYFSVFSLNDASLIVASLNAADCERELLLSLLMPASSLQLCVAPSGRRAHRVSVLLH